MELCLAEHPLVRECGVLALELPDRRMTLQACVVLEGAGARMRQRQRPCRRM